MAISLTERWRADIGGKKWIVYEVDLPLSTAAITAASLDLTYIEASWMCQKKTSLSLGSTISGAIGGPQLKDTGASTGITISGVCVSGDAVVLNVIGW